MKYALVTGGSRGIGKAVCLKIASDLKYNILLNYNSNTEAAEETRAEIEARLNEDPFVEENVVRAEILEIAPNRVDERLSFLAG